MLFHAGASATVVTLITEVLLCLVLHVLILVQAHAIKVILASTFTNLASHNSTLGTATNRPYYVLLFPQIRRHFAHVSIVARVHRLGPTDAHKVVNIILQTHHFTSFYLNLLFKE